MAYKSIFMVWDGRENSYAALQTALRLSREHDAHLSVLCIGYNMYSSGFYHADLVPVMITEGIEAAREQAANLENEVDQILKNEDVKWSIQTGISHSGGLSYLVGDAARYNDLVVHPKARNSREDVYNPAVVIEAALFTGNVPVLVHPDKQVEMLGKRIVIAWNESDEALNAIRAALPLIKTADLVDVVIIDPNLHGSDRSDPGLALSTMLARHGAKVEVSVIPRTVLKISDILNRRVAETGADLLVMGAFGHSRFRESVLGGATSDTLKSAIVPVLMAH